MQIELGKIAGVWGVKGWVKLHSYTRNRVEIADYSHWWLAPPKKKVAARLGDQATQFKVEICRSQGQTMVAKLTGVETRERAQELDGYKILVDQDELPELPEGEYYWQELIGLSVENLDGLEFGEIESILETGANDVLVIKSKQDEANESTAEVLVPYVDQVVKKVDLTIGKMIVDWDASFLED